MEETVPAWHFPSFAAPQVSNINQGNTDGSTDGHVLQASLMSALLLFEIREETLRGEERPHEQSPSTVEENEKVPSP